MYTHVTRMFKKGQTMQAQCMKRAQGVPHHPLQGETLEIPGGATSLNKLTVHVKQELNLTYALL